jgi:2,3-bisphosphoglycerate-dependent phosphoglycerate mutase
MLILCLMKILKHVVFVVLMCISYSVFAQTTTIWLVRHAEKEAVAAGTEMMSVTDPNLSAEGKLRAEALAAELKDQKITAVFSTPYKRTLQTAEPTLKQFKLTTAEPYDPAKLAAFAKHVLTFYAGSNVLIVGHSNTVIPTLQAFGGTKPFDTLTDDDYDLLFKITVGPYKVITTTVKYYGSKHHTTQLK